MEKLEIDPKEIEDVFISLILTGIM